MKDQQRVKFGNHVARLRRQSMLTREQLAEMAQLKPFTIKNIEAGNFNVPLDVLNRIAVVLGGELKIVLNDLNEFMNGDNNKEDYLSKCEKLFDIFYKERGNFIGNNNVHTSQKIEVSTQASKNYINQKEEPKNGKFYK